ncbi:hypothetical protein IFM89_035478 [Coptis chinensis]|uniref:LTI65/LTI78 PGEED repeat domain-containing protein n=1 Tax=Coptis chinensis TaxID=261450 RepID=A0A835H8U4_9MAGN|nr:hypothetical protein IFM89_035478 [Coptis chinensis]
MNVDQPNQGGYTDKMPSVNSAIADKALSAKNIVASNIGYGDKIDDKTAGAQTDKGENVPSVGAPIVTTESVEEPTTQQSSYTKKISSAAVSAKNMAASKLGYGGGLDSTSSTGAELNKGGERECTSIWERSWGWECSYFSPDSALSTEAELNKGGENAPVYGKEAGAGSAVISKIPGTGMITQKNTDEGIGVDTNMGTGSQVDTGRGVGEIDKGVASVKGYIAEKLKPGEEDKALESGCGQ